MKLDYSLNTMDLSNVVNFGGLATKSYKEAKFITFKNGFTLPYNYFLQAT